MKTFRIRDTDTCESAAANSSTATPVLLLSWPRITQNDFNVDKNGSEVLRTADDMLFWLVTCHAPQKFHAEPGQPSPIQTASTQY